MGFSISWIAVRNKTSGALLTELALKPTGEMSECPEVPICGRPLPNGWFLLLFEEIDHELVKKKSLAVISKNCDIVACSIEEHAMIATSEFWQNGQQIWRIEHNAQQGIVHLEASGNMPSDYVAVVQKYSAQQEAAENKKRKVDYFFEIPLQIAKNIVGFKHDNYDFQDEGFEEFRAVPVSTKSPFLMAAQNDPNFDSPTKKPWWKVW